MLVRVAPIRARPAPEPPILFLNSTSGSGASSTGPSKASGGKGGSRGISSVGRGGAAAAAPAQEPPPPAADPAAAPGGPKLNVLVLFIDSVSRRHFFRRMGKTAAALEEIAARGAADVYQFFRYHTGEPSAAQRAQRIRCAVPCCAQPARLLQGWLAG